MEIVEKILNKIREARKAKKLSQAEMGKILGISQNSYKNLETGQSELKMPVFLKVCEVLEIESLIGEERSEKIDNINFYESNYSQEIEFLNYLIHNKEHLNQLKDTLEIITQDIRYLFSRHLPEKTLNLENRVKQINLKATEAEKKLIIEDANENQKSLIDNYLDYIKAKKERNIDV